MTDQKSLLDFLKSPFQTSKRLFVTSNRTNGPQFSIRNPENGSLLLVVERIKAKQRKHGPFTHGVGVIQVYQDWSNFNLKKHFEFSDFADFSDNSQDNPLVFVEIIPAVQRVDLWVRPLGDDSISAFLIHDVQIYKRVELFLFQIQDAQNNSLENHGLRIISILTSDGTCDMNNDGLVKSISMLFQNDEAHPVLFRTENIKTYIPFNNSNFSSDVVIFSPF
jgi:hypothetical protein